MGAAVTPSIIAGGANLASSAANLYMNERNIDYQQAENEKNRKFNASEAEKSRVFSTNERIAQQMYNTQERVAAQNYQTGERLATQAFNSPVNQVAQLSKAGINPAVYFSGSGASSTVGRSSPMSSSGQSSSLPSSLSASFDGGLNTQVPNMPQLLTGASDLINALTNAGVGEANIDLINANTKVALEKVFTQQQITEAQKLQNALNKENFPNEVKKLIAEVASLNAQIGLTEQQTEKVKLEKALVRANTRLVNRTAKLRGFEAVTAKIYSEQARSLFQSQINANNASAKLAGEQAQTEKETRPEKITSFQLENGLKAVDYNVKSLTEMETVQQVKDEAARLHKALEKGDVLGKYLPQKGLNIPMSDFEQALLNLWHKYKANVDEAAKKSQEKRR